jgi:hypothetical protein
MTMKKAALPILLVVVAALYGCGKKTEDHSHHHEQQVSGAEDPNKALYDSVMGVHDQVMPRLDEMFKLSESLRDKIAKTPDMPAPKKQEIEAAIDSLDEANEGMMVWMRQFSPVTDTADRQAARNYLNAEMVKVERVRTDILSAIEKGKALQ